jgi:hypothetical protein
MTTTTTTANCSPVRLGDVDTPLSKRPRSSMIGRILCFFGRHDDREVSRFPAKELPPVIGHECANCERRSLQGDVIHGELGKATQRRLKRQWENATAWRDRSPDHQPKPRGRKPRVQQHPSAEATPPLLQLSGSDPCAEAKADQVGESAHE